MKGIQKLGVSICCVTIIVSCLTFYASGITKNIFDEKFREGLINEIDIESPLNRALINLPDGYIISEYVLKNSNEIKNSIINNEDFINFVNKYGQSIVHSVANENTSNTNLNDDFNKIINNQEKNIKKSMGSTLSSEQKTLLVSAIKDNVDLNPVYNSLVDRVRGELSSKQLYMVKLLDGLTNPFVRTLSIILMLSAIIGIIIMRLYAFECLYIIGIPYIIGGGLLFIASKVAPIILMGARSLPQLFIEQECVSMSRYAYVDMGIGILMCIIYFILSKIRRNWFN